MAPRFTTLRPAQTASAREAMRAFFCELCQKGYSRMNEYEAHLSSYDHAHKQRLKDMKAMVRDPAASARARRQEAKAADAMISIKVGGEGVGGGGSSSGGAGGGLGGGFKKGGFKSAFVTAAAPPAPPAPPPAADEAAPTPTSTPAQPPLDGISIELPPVTAPSASFAEAAPATTLPPPLPLVGAARRQGPTGGHGDDYDGGGSAESDTDDEGYEVYDPRQPTD